MPDAIDIAAVEDVCRRLAPDLTAVPLYILRAEELPADRGGLVKVLGYTYPDLDAHLADVIGDEWRGRGPAMVLSAEQIAADHPPEQLASMFLSVAVHELAHVLDMAALYPLEPARSESPRKQRPPSAVELAEARHLAGSVSGPELPDEPEHHHGPGFLRACVHLLHRADALGVPLWRSTIVGGGDRKKCFGSDRYAAALGGEPVRMAGASFAEIGRTPIPAALVELWQAERDGLPLPARYRSSPAKEKTCPPLASP